MFIFVSKMSIIVKKLTIYVLLKSKYGNVKNDG